jgi:hypothetical protein
MAEPIQITAGDTAETIKADIGAIVTIRALPKR